MVQAGHRTNSPRTLLVLFTLWVPSPFVAVVFAIIVSKDWSVLTRATLYSVVVFLTVSSLAIYGDVAFGPPRTKTAFAFVAVPPASWLLIAITVLIAGLISGSAHVEATMANRPHSRRQVCPGTTIDIPLRSPYSVPSRYTAVRSLDKKAHITSLYKVLCISENARGSNAHLIG
jgi:hypothetical protein